MQCQNNLHEYKHLISEERSLSSDEEIIESHNIKRRTDEACSGRCSDQPVEHTSTVTNKNAAETEDENLYNSILSLKDDVNVIRIQEDEVEMYIDVIDTSNSGVATSKQNSIDGSPNGAYIEMHYNEQNAFDRDEINEPLFERNASANETSDNYDSLTDESEDEQLAKREEDEVDGESEERPERQPFDLNFMFTPVFEGSNTTVGETMFLIETFTSRHNLNKVGFQELLDILNILIGLNALPRTIHLWDKQFLYIFSTIEYH